jgi:hypothetical protein
MVLVWYQQNNLAFPWVLVIVMVVKMSMMMIKMIKMMMGIVR